MYCYMMSGLMSAPDDAGAVIGDRLQRGLRASIDDLAIFMAGIIITFMFGFFGPVGPSAMISLQHPDYQVSQHLTQRIKCGCLPVCTSPHDMSAAAGKLPATCCLFACRGPACTGTALSVAHARAMASAGRRTAPSLCPGCVRSYLPMLTARLRL